MAEQGGLLSFLNSPTGMGLLSAVGAGLAGARRGGSLNALGTGIMGGVQGFAQGQDLQQQQAYNQQRSKLFDAQMQNYQAEADARKTALEQQQRQREYLNTIGAVTSPRLDAQPNQANPRQMLALGMSPDFIKTYMTADTLSLPKVARTVEVDDGNGGKATMQLDEYGRPVGNSLPAYIAPVQVNRGGSIDFVKPTPGTSLSVTMSPAERDASARGWKGLRIQEDNARRESQAVTYQQDGDGNFVALPTKVTPGSVVRGLPVVAGPGMTPMRGGTSKLGEGQKKQISGIESLSNAVDAYTSALDQWDKAKFVSPNERAKMGTLYNNMMLQAKEAYNLGVLNGPDYEILQSVVKDPTSAGSLLVSNDTLKTQATTLRNMLQGNVESIRNPGRQAQGQGSQQPSVRRYNPATGRIE